MCSCLFFIPAGHSCERRLYSNKKQPFLKKAVFLFIYL
ncbi:hypothetical protein BAXH7_02767 [Bacillus amyloliquefaciens XH7]|nr:hypothetical protein LL3_02842 [Bacillus amyloliquefaciens LL3]AEK89893.1 hypothetical protein BAXH7_02767 [Bacillus amyloliquefaciens XH7]KYC95343.1 hypothetical protein B425_2179 [Bacillus amyloliquefaciens]